jgi:hypothetical protein
MGPHWPTRAAYSWRPGFIHFLPISRIQRRDIWIVNSAYKIIPARYLESEIAIPPLDLYFDK